MPVATEQSQQPCVWEAARIAVVIPVFDDEACLLKLVGHIQDVIGRAGLEATLVIVDDGSPSPIDGQKLRAASDLAHYVIRLTRNVGHQSAIAIGLAHVVATELASVVLVMDADGEDQPTDIPRLVSELIVARDATVVVARRARRSEGVLFAAFYRLYRALFRLLTGNQIQFGNFLAMRIDAARRLAAMPELWVNLPAAVLRSRLVISAIAADRGRRYFGQSKMRPVSLVMHGFSAIAVFTDRVLTRLTLAAIATITVTCTASLIAFMVKVLGFASPGWLTTVFGTSLIVTSMACVLCLIGLLMTLSGGSLFVPQPIASYGSFVAGIIHVAYESRTAPAGK